MRRLQKILLGAFLGGILLGGIGTGVAFVEYSSIAYAGEKKIGAESMVTKDFEFSFDKEKGIVNIAPVWYDEGQISSVETDEAVPEGVIRYRVTYNAKTVIPRLHFSENDDGITDASESNQESVHCQGRLHLEKDYRDDFGLWMENKDEILSDLKQGRIASYQVSYVTDVKIFVNPASEDFIKQER